MTSTVYVLSNEAMPGLLKIGRTGQTSPLPRMGELYTTGVPLPFECELAMAIDDDQAQQIETALHRAFDPHRVNPKREFFRMNLEQVAAILKVWPGAEDVTDDARRELDAEIEQGERDALRRERRRRPRLDLPELGIRDGDQLEFAGKTDSPLTVEVVEAAKQLVKMGDETLHLRDATRNVMGRDSSATVRQANHWLFEGKRLVDLYEELYTEPDV